jgi:hypothetical protein
MSRAGDAGEAHAPLGEERVLIAGIGRIRFAPSLT